MSVRERAVSLGFAAGWAVLPRVPERLGAALFDRVADELWLRRGKSVRQLEANLARVVGADAASPAVRSLSRRGLRSYMRYFHEMFRLPAMSGERIMSGMVLGGEDLITSNLERGRGVVLALPHMGNWDHAGAWLVRRGVPFTTVAERLRPESLYERYKSFRESLGMEVLPLTGGEGHVFGTLAQRLRRGGVVCLPADRDLTAAGVEVEFFGETTRMPAGPAALAVHTGAALLPATLWFEGNGWRGHVHEEIAVPGAGTRQEKTAAMTQALARVFEKGVAEHPEDWHMLQRLWLADLEPRERTA
ncbi:phosphatidylinositol mannoside acyltransferase [Bailinhaonella thermotolerans]|uniref:Phosphatidylinositol mannoside acyltransferase n=1 Tax=Bailinhaonella thermotolerans TaxID=1070861 RepID=A0A3A4AZJ1_9ACTN|nr:phosphatidylinositol mannoside acyltransferase [Bailinhaonella thermotolerans]RJL33999.1 phosphatidylinositol mannoside acyltransferase [Bailinhaonella thermotolerans]